MRVYDCRLVRPTHARLVDALEEATRAADEGYPLLGLDREHWHTFVPLIRASPEGLRCWPRTNWRLLAVALLRVAWWTDHLGRRHFRVWADRWLRRDWMSSALDRDERFQALYAREERRPPLWHLYPERIFARTREGRTEHLAVCACGACDTPHALGWLGECCRPCHDRRQGVQAPEAPPTTFRDHTGPVTALAFSPGGKLLASAGEVGLALSPEGELQTVTGDDWRVRLWDVASGTRCGLVGRPDEQVGAFAFAPAGDVLACVGDRTLRLTDLATGREWVTNQVPARAGALAFSPDGAALALATRKELELWARGAGGAWVPARSRAGGVGAVAFSPRGDVLAVGERGARLRLLDRLRPDWELPVRARGQKKWGVWALAFTPDGRTLLSVSSHRRPRADRPDGPLLECWDAATAGLEREEPLAPACRWGFSLDSSWLAGVQGTSLIVQDVPDGRHATTLEWDPCEPLSCVAFSPDGQTLATGGERGTVKLWPWRKLLEV